jgi:hypothetical protein
LGLVEQNIVVGGEVEVVEEREIDHVIVVDGSGAVVAELKHALGEEDDVADLGIAE